MADENTSIADEAVVEMPASAPAPKKVRGPNRKKAEAAPADAEAQPAESVASPVKRGRKPAAVTEVASKSAVTDKVKAKPGPKTTAQKPVSGPVVKSVESAKPVDGFSELLQLEEENTRLRKALSEKLRAENADLRKRLGEK
jgi:putative transposase